MNMRIITILLCISINIFSCGNSKSEETTSNSDFAHQYYSERLGELINMPQLTNTISRLDSFSILIIQNKICDCSQIDSNKIKKLMSDRDFVLISVDGERMEYLKPIETVKIDINTAQKLGIDFVNDILVKIENKKVKDWKILNNDNEKKKEPKTGIN